jgi:hypothetical protein
MTAKFLDIFNDITSEVRRLLSKPVAAKAVINFPASIRITNVPRFDYRISSLKKRYLRSLQLELKTALDNAMSASVWGENSTDIIDTGELQSSLQIKISGDRLDIGYYADYAALVHYGGYVLPYGNPNAARVYIAGRPWVESVLFDGGPVDRYDFQALWERTLREGI